jgi:ureidoacrylate peracid hydrolase
MDRSLSMRPEALSINPAQSAVIVVDMQNDFGSEGGMFALAGIDISGIQKAIAPTARVLAAARHAGLLENGFPLGSFGRGSPRCPQLD